VVAVPTLSEQISELEHLSEAAISVKMVDGFRKWWKQWANRSKSVKVSAYDLTPALNHLREGMLKVSQLTEDLVIKRGMYTQTKATAQDKKHRSFEFAYGRVKDLLREADEALSDGIHRIKFWNNVITPGTDEYKRGSGHRYVVEKDAKEKGITLEQAIKPTMQGTFDEATKKADSAISRKLLRHLKVIIKEFDFLGKPGTEKVEFGDALTKFKIGKLDVVMLDVGKHEKLKYSKKAPVRPRSFDSDRVAHMMIKAQRLLSQKGLGKLWYGETRVYSKAKAGDIRFKGYEGKKAAGHYEPSRDRIAIFTSNTPYIPQLMLHELGHRYYWKFMSQTDRRTFDSWFGKVSPVSTYGGTVSSEDFAEVFSHYCMNKELTRDQLERFKRFLGRKNEEVEPYGPLVPTLAEQLNELESLSEARKPVHGPSKDEWYRNTYLVAGQRGGAKGMLWGFKKTLRYVMNYIQGGKSWQADTIKDGVKKGDFSWKEVRTVVSGLLSDRKFMEPGLVPNYVAKLVTERLWEMASRGSIGKKR
jgi:hypothetical protein